MHRESWDDLRFVLAVVKNGSVSAASRALGVNHATVLRRVAQFEEAFGIEVFVKTRTGYRVPQENTELIEAILEAEHAVLAVAQVIKEGQQPLRGDIRITSTDTLCALVLPRVIHQIQSREEALSFEVLSSNLHLDLARKMADIVVRPTRALPAELRGQQAGRLVFGVYRGAKTAADTPNWLGLSGPLHGSVAGVWIDENVDHSSIVAASDSFLTLAGMLGQGHSKTYLPLFVGQADDRLVRCDNYPQLEVPLWVACHVDIASSARTQRVVSRLVQGLLREEPLLLGLSEPAEV